jgi:hypothetical protein
MSETENLKAARDYLAALERFEAPSELFHPEVVQTEYPNRYNPEGQVRRGGDMGGGLERARQMLRRQTYEVVSAIASGDRVVMEVTWRAELNVPVGSLKPGDEMTCLSGIFLEFRDGLIWRQQNYDCFPPF